jgi:DNA-binding winged helix-turn-helix (wHTH) protein
LHQKLWPSDTFVDFVVGLNSAIRKLRQALNDDADHPHYIETLAKRGYRFLAPVTEIDAKGAEQKGARRRNGVRRKGVPFLSYPTAYNAVG